MHADPKRMNENIPGHCGLGIGNEDKIFQHKTKGARLELIQRALEQNGEKAADVISLFNFDAATEKQRPAGNLEGTYLLTLENDEQRIMRVKKIIFEEFSRQADGIFAHVEAFNRAANQSHLISLSHDIPFQDGQYVHNIDEYSIDMKTYQDGRHITSNPTAEQIKAVAAGMAAFRNGMDTLPADTADQIKRNAPLYSERTATAIKMIEDTPELVMNLLNQAHNAQDAQRIFDLISEAADAFGDEAISSHGWASDANLLITAEGSLHVIDNELTPFACWPRGYDEGVALSRAIIGKMDDTSPQATAEAFNTFLETYNQYAHQPLTEADMKTAMVLGNINSVYFGLAYSQEESMKQDAVPTLQRHGSLLLENHAKMDALPKVQNTALTAAAPKAPDEPF